MNNILSFLADAGNYESRVVDRTDVKGITVSTCYTSDEGYESALLDENGAHPVERYASKAMAEKGHAKWVKKAATAKTVVKLGGLGGLVGNTKIVLKRPA